MTDAELLVWATAHLPAGSTLAAAVFRLLDQRDRLADDLTHAVSRLDAVVGLLKLCADELMAQRVLNVRLAERVAGQSELLSRRSETGGENPSAQSGTSLPN